MEGDSQKPWEKHFKDFEYYEPLFIDRLEDLNQLQETLKQEEAQNSKKQEEDD